MIKRDMPLADKILTQHKTKGYYRPWIKTIMFDYGSELIEKFRQHMINAGYADADLYAEFNMDEWLKENI